jgi:hypothetical protein
MSRPSKKYPSRDTVLLNQKYCLYLQQWYGVLPKVAPDLSLAGRNVAHEELEEGGLADPVGPDNRHPGGHVDAELNVLEQGRLAGVVETEQAESGH